MSAAYVPVFKSILGSTIWGEAPHVKVVWLTMLMLKGRDGFVGYSVPGLMREAVVSREQCEEALTVLMSPDVDSKSTDYEGRRLVAVDGGWLVVNHQKYSDLVSESGRERVRKFRERQKESKQPAVTDVTLRAVTERFPLDIGIGLDSSLSGSPDDKPKTKKRPKAKKEDGVPVEKPEGWEPTKSHREFAAKHGIDVEIESVRFQGHFDSQRLLSWNGRFAKWLGNAVVYGRERTANGNHSPAAITAQPNQPISGQTKPDGQVYHRDGYWYHPLPNQPKAAE